MSDIISIAGENPGIVYRDANRWQIKLDMTEEEVRGVEWPGDKFIQQSPDGSSVSLFYIDDSGIASTVLKQEVDKDYELDEEFPEDNAFTDAVQTLMNKYDVYRILAKLSNDETLAIINTSSGNLVYGINIDSEDLNKPGSHAYLGALSVEATELLKEEHGTYIELDVSTDAKCGYSLAASSCYDGEEFGEYKTYKNISDKYRLIDKMFLELRDRNTELQYHAYEDASAGNNPGQVWSLSERELKTISEMLHALDIRVTDIHKTVPELEKASIELAPDSVADIVKNEIENAKELSGATR